MSFDDRQRLDEDQRQPRITKVHLALARLRSCITFMNSGAHPDDEISALLAVLSYREGFDVSFACANRGEGGQNDIGTQSSAALGTLRTAEMEAAAAVLDMRLYWLSTHQNDSIFDFGFSKSGEETLKHWNRERTLARFVSIVRREQPDILCTTFLDVPGQHGHHRAMTLLAHQVMESAADESFRIDEMRELSDDLSPDEKQQRQHMANTPWQISKLYLPAFGGGGSAYDDEQPPPQATLSVTANDRDAVTGWSWENLGQQSRRFHLTQGMGRWVKHGGERNWPLHLAKTQIRGADPLLSSGLARDFNQWALHTEDKNLAMTLQRVHDALTKTMHAFPVFNAITDSAFTAVAAINDALALIQSEAHLTLRRRLLRKQSQLTNVIMIASGANPRAWSGQTFWRPGQSSTATLDIVPPEQQDIVCNTTLLASRMHHPHTPWSVNANTLTLGSAAVPANPYPDTWFPDEPVGPVVKISLVRDGTTVHYHQPLETPPVILPARSALIQPNTMLLNLAQPRHPITVSVYQRHPENASPSVELPDGWSQSTQDNEITLSPPATMQAGLFTLPLTLDNQPAMQQHTIAYSHIKPKVFTSPAQVRILAMSVELPDVRIGYIGGGNDRVAFWLRSMGLTVHELNDSELGDASALQHALQSIDTLVIGVFAYRMRENLVALTPTINSWVHSGGHLLTLYHRPWDNWEPQSTPPARLEIGQPSLRYRITDENATVSYLEPTHSLLNTPNALDETDWQGWHKERGLYFAKSWDGLYTPLLSMNDPGEAPHEGALLVARLGRGQHIHTSLILHHQMEHLVPGAFRLMANLLS